MSVPIKIEKIIREGLKKHYTCIYETQVKKFYFFNYNKINNHTGYKYSEEMFNKDLIHRLKTITYRNTLILLRTHFLVTKLPIPILINLLNPSEDDIERIYNHLLDNPELDLDCLVDLKPILKKSNYGEFYDYLETIPIFNINGKKIK